MKKQEMDVYVLCAGKQTRYGQQRESKMMANVHGRPAFAYMMDTLKTAFPEDRITVVTSSLFPDLNNFVTDTYPQSQLQVDDTPGKGSTYSLATTFPWRSERAFVTEGDIYYKPELIKGQIDLLKKEPDTKVVITATPHVGIASTHRGISVTPKLEIAESGNEKNNPTYRNIGAYTVSSQIESHIDVNPTPNLIEVIRYMYLSGEQVAANIYLAAYLHIATTKDIKGWEEYFRKIIDL